MSTTQTLVKERPILFSGAMVPALLDGSKTQTRRAINPQPTEEEKYPDCFRYNGPLVSKEGPFGILAHCPYGRPGERLWVRETLFWSNCDDDWCYQADNAPLWADRTDHYTAPILLKNKPAIPSIHMPREASRLLLEVVSVRVERLNNISEADAVAEGIEPYDLGGVYKLYGSECSRPIGSIAATRTDYVQPVKSYESLWESINGAGSWERNPWVWVVEFKVIEPTNG